MSVSVLVSHAVGLQNIEKIGKIDPFVSVSLQGVKKETKKQDNTVDPKWDETFTFDLGEKPPSKSERITVHVFDHEKIGRNRLLGQATVNLRNIVTSPKPVDFELKLLDKNDRPAKGVLNLSVKFIAPTKASLINKYVASGYNIPGASASGASGGTSQSGNEEQPVPDKGTDTADARLGKRLQDPSKMQSSKKEKFQIRIKIVEGRSLMGSDLNPVCRVAMSNVTKQTRVKRHTNSPWWDEIFFFQSEMVPVDLFSETIEFQVSSSRRLRSSTLIGMFKLDVGVVHDQDKHAFINKWLLLSNPEDTMAGVLGYLKVSIVVLGPGDDCPSLKATKHNEEEDMESNLLLPAGVQLKPATFALELFQGEDLPRMDANCLNALTNLMRKRDENTGTVDPYLRFFYSGQEVESKVMYCNDHPAWEQCLYLGFQFPSVCESIKLILKDWDRVTEDDTIATAFIHLPMISAPGDQGYLPTFGPAYINFYGSPREYSELGSEFEALDEGKGEGCAYRGRALISLSTQLGAYPDSPTMAIENEDLLRVQPFCRRRRYRLHAAFIDAMMVSVIDSPVEFEVSIGNFGNKFEDTMVPSPSTTQPTNAVFDGCQYYFLPWKETKPCVVINSQWEDISFRLETVNILIKIGDSLQENAMELRKMLDQAQPMPQIAIRFVAAMDLLISQTRCKLPEPVSGHHVQNELDTLLRQQREHELKFIHNQAVTLRENATEIDEALKEIEVYINTLRALAVEPQNSMPDVIIWMLSGKKRIAYFRIPAHEILYSPKEECQGKFCGKLRTITLKYPGMNKNTKLLQIPLLLRIKMWLGLESYDGEWCRSQTDAELAVFAETYENQVNFLGNWTVKGPTMSRPPFSDANGSLALPKDKFEPPLGWKFDGDWFINPEPSMLYDEDSGHKTFLEDVFENQFRIPALHWQPSSSQWTDVRGDQTQPIQDIHPPVGWVWDDAWQIDLNRAVDEEGWEYAVEATLGGYSPVEHTYHLCRRRRWVRMRTFIKDLKVTESGDSDQVSSEVNQGTPLLSFPQEDEKALVKQKIIEDGWEYAPLFNLKFHAKERRMDLVRRRRWHRKLVAEDATAPLVFNLGEAKQKMKEEDAKHNILSCPRLFLIYKEGHKYQLRVYLYQARHLPAADRSGFSDPFACISFMNQSKKTEVISQTLCPTWDQTLFFDEIFIYGKKEAVASHPPMIVIEVYDRDIVGEPEFLGRCTVRPIVHLDPDKAVAPRMEWTELTRGKQFSGEILASYELFLDDERTLPFLPPKKGNLFIVPSGIRPVLQRTGIEILCWGVRNMRTFEFTNIQSPSIEFECGEKIVQSNVIRDIKFNPNFDNPIIFFEMLLPREDLYMPAIHIKVRDHRQFGRKPIVGTHLIRSLFEYRCKPAALEEVPDEIPAGVEEIAIEINADDAEEESEEPDETIDWWSKYYASIGEIEKAGQYLDKGYETIEVFPVTLERIEPFQKFNDLLHCYPLYRGKTKESEESAVVGEFKGTFRVYALPGDPNAPLPPKALRGLPSSSAEDIIVRIYVIRAHDLAPKDPNGLSDPFVTVRMGRKKANFRDDYRPNTVNPIFGQMFELRGSLPLDKDLVVSIKDYDLVGSDDLIGETLIDLENRYLTKYRATCGLPKQYYTSGPNVWRDGKKPREILREVCELQNLPHPRFYSDSSISIGKKYYSVNQFEPDLNVAGKDKSTKIEEEKEPPNPHLGPLTERMALYVLNTMNLVPEHVETRPLFNPMTPGLEQGKLEMWVDIFPKATSVPGPAYNVSPRVPKKFELRMVIWNTYDVLLNDVNVLGEEMSDIYVKCCISGLDEVQKTDVHYRSMDGEGNFNWRFVFPFEYLVAEQTIVIRKKAHFWSLDTTELHLPPKISLQIWDNDMFSSDDFIGEIELDLTKMALPEKNVSRCGLQQLGIEAKNEGGRLNDIRQLTTMLSKKKDLQYMSLFEKNRVYGFWPTLGYDEEKGALCAGKLEVEMEIVEGEDEIEKRPAGRGRDEPNANPTLEPPNRPATSFMWFTSPLKSFRYIIWRNYKWYIISFFLITLLILLVALFIYSFPGSISDRIVGN